MNVARMNVGARLGVGFALVLVFLVLIGVFAIRGMSQIEQRLENVVNVNNVKTRLAIEMRTLVNDRTTGMKNLTLLTDAGDMQPEIDRIKALTQSYVDASGKIEAILQKDAGTTPEERDLFQKVKEQENAANAPSVKALELWLGNKPEDATKVLIKEIRPVQKKWIEALNALAALEDKTSANAVENARSAYSGATTFIVILGVVSLIVGIAAAAWITRSLLRQLGGEPDYAASIANKIAAGDLAGSFYVKSGDSQSLLASMKAMNDSLINIVSQVRQGTDAIATASREIAAGNLDLSSRTEQQASSLEKTASSMEQLTATVKQNAESARQANSLAASASDVARKGGDVVAEVVNTMDSINASSRKIVDIISVIDGIAFQTNILALNAAVEAARAGEQGRGFAVVASEVRNLAQRSAAAAKEIKTLIGDSVEKVESGTKLVSQAGLTMNEVVESVRRVTDIMAEISHASMEQSAGIEQVNLAISDMDGVTQQNAALVEEAASAAQSLQNQATELANVVSVFKLSDQDSRLRSTNTNDIPARVTKVTSAASKALPKPRVSSPAKAAPVKTQVATAKASATDASDWEEF